MFLVTFALSSLEGKPSPRARVNPDGMPSARDATLHDLYRSAVGRCRNVIRLLPLLRRHSIITSAVSSPPPTSSPELGNSRRLSSTRGTCPLSPGRDIRAHLDLLAMGHEPTCKNVRLTRCF